MAATVVPTCIAFAPRPTAGVVAKSSAACFVKGAACFVKGAACFVTDGACFVVGGACFIMGIVSKSSSSELTGAMRAA